LVARVLLPAQFGNWNSIWTRFCRVGTNHAPVNFATLKYMAHNPPRRPVSEDSFRLRRKVAGWDDEIPTGFVT
jgi:hypothetical protein